LTLETTSVETHSAGLEIHEKPEDTPRSVMGARRAPAKVILAFAATTQILDPSYSELNDDAIFIVRDITARSEDEGLQGLVRVIVDEEMSAHEPPRMPDAEIANRDRLELLARAYVGGQLSAEEDARLAIVTERVRRLIPRVTVADFERLEEIAKDMERIGSEDSERRRRLGLA